MERKSRLLIEVVVVMLCVSIALTFMRTMALKDFYIVPIYESEEGNAPEE